MYNYSSRLAWRIYKVYEFRHQELIAMLLDTVRKTISEYRMLEKGDKVLCAVSGGADSICLLDVMLALKEELSQE